MNLVVPSPCETEPYNNDQYYWTFKRHLTKFNKKYTHFGFTNGAVRVPLIINSSRGSFVANTGCCSIMSTFALTCSNIKDNHCWTIQNNQTKLRVYLGVRTCELFRCFVAIVRVMVYYFMLTSLFSLLYVTGEFHRCCWVPCIVHVFSRHLVPAF